MSQQRQSRVQDDNRKIVMTFHNSFMAQNEKKYKKNVAIHKGMSQHNGSLKEEVLS